MVNFYKKIFGLIEKIILRYNYKVVITDSLGEDAIFL